MKSSLARIGFFLLITLEFAFGGLTGKIAGTIKDAETDEMLSGVNVYLEGTTLGAASDADGYYVILNVPPGTYTLVASMIGYERTEITNIRVAIDLTTTLNLELYSTVLGLGEVTVVAERPVIAPDVSASQVNIQAETIMQMPVISVTEVIGLQAGIEGLEIRGSESYQNLFIVDGLLLTDERRNLPYTAISLSSVKEIQIQTGGFNAEYGNVRSGVINVITKEGDRKRYSGTATVRYNPPTPKHFGPSIFDPNTYATRPFLDDDVCWTGTTSGAWDKYQQRQYRQFKGWNATAEALIADQDPTNDLSPTALQRLWKWEKRRQGDIDIPDYTIDMGFGGPIPIIGPKLGNLRFYLSARSEQEAFIYPLSRDSYNENMTQLKLTSDIGQSMKLTVSGLYGEIHSVSPAQWTTPPEGNYFRSVYGLASDVLGDSPNDMVYMPGYYNPMAIYRTVLGAHFSHILSDRTYYDVSVQYMFNQYYTDRTADRDTTRKYEIVPDYYYADEAPYGYYAEILDSFTDGMRMGGWMGFSWDRSRNSTFTFKSDLTSQINPVNQVKTGFHLVYNAQRINSANLSAKDTWTYFLEWERFPYRVSAYLQDKIEIKEFIANLGLRLDHSNANGTWYDLEPYDDLLTRGKGDKIDELATKTENEGLWYLSPRLGISYPIMVNSKLYFNYGHFRQSAQNSYRFRLNRKQSGAIYQIGDPDLPPSKTVAYELGFEQNILDMYLLRIAGYYKDVTEQPSWSRYLTKNRNVDVYRAMSDSYEDIRGLELTLEKRTGGLITGFINYTYSVSSSGYFGYRNYYQDLTEQLDDIALNPDQSKPHPIPYLRLNLNIHIPTTFGPRFLGLYPIGGWNANFLGNWRAGSYFTYNPQLLPGIVDNVQWTDYYNADLRFSKTVQIYRAQVQLFVDISNLFNFKTFSDAGFAGSEDRDQYMASLHLPFEEGAEHGDDQPGDYRKHGVDFAPIETVGDLSRVVPISRVIYYNTSGEEYLDANGNSVWDTGETFTDLNENGSYDGPGTYWQYKEESWGLVDEGYLDQVLEDRAYIDMPNFTYFTFLNPRQITVGIKVNF